jgi:hypothetical protein
MTTQIPNTLYCGVKRNSSVARKNFFIEYHSSPQEGDFNYSVVSVDSASADSSDSSEHADSAAVSAGSSEHADPADSVVVSEHAASVAGSEHADSADSADSVVVSEHAASVAGSEHADSADSVVVAASVASGPPCSSIISFSLDKLIANCCNYRSLNTSVIFIH